MRKLLIMASLFYPQKNGGGPPVSIMNVIRGIKNEFEIYVISHNFEVGDTAPLPGVNDGWNEFDFGKVYYFSHGTYNVKNIYGLICEINPDVIYQNSFFSYEDALPTLLYKKKNPKTGIVIAPRGEVCENRFNKGRLKKVLYARLLKTLKMFNNVYFQATGEDESFDITRFLGIDKSMIYNVNNFSIANEEYVTAIEKITGVLKLCFIARIQDTKNLLYAIERLKNIKHDVTYDIYGPIENKAYYDQCFSVDLPDNIKVNYCGMVDHDDVGKVISHYHAYYMPTIGENYGHSIVEGMLYNRPVIISDKTPWTGINEAGAGFAIKLDEPEKFESAIDTLCMMDQEEFDEMCRNSKVFIGDKLHIDETIKQYIKMFNEV